MPTEVGLMGGTFDPVHNGHVSIAKSFVESGLIDELWILLTPYPPHKKNEDHSDYSLRLEMLKNAFEGFSNLKISTIENKLPKPSYTVRTIRYFKKKHPDKRFYFCMGEDSLSQFHNWKKSDEILEECNLLVAHRPEATHEDVDPEILSKVRFVDHEPVDISSTMIRKRLRAGKSISELVPDKVNEIIEKKNLYR